MFCAVFIVLLAVCAGTYANESEQFDAGKIAQGAIESTGEVASHAGKTVVGAAQSTGAAAHDITVGVGKASFGAVENVGKAVNNVREGVIDTFGVREVHVSEKIYFEGDAVKQKK